MFILNLTILNKFLNELIGSRESIELQDLDLVTIVKAVDTKEEFWHIEEAEISTYLWRVKQWKAGLLARERRKQEHEEYRERILLLQDMLQRIKIGVTKKLGFNDSESPAVFTIALAVLNSRNEIMGLEFGVVGLGNVAKLDKPHLVMNTETEYYNIL